MDRFSGVQGVRRLAEALARQTVINGDRELIKRLLDVLELTTFDTGQLLIEAGDAGADVFFILSGRVSVEIQGLEVAIRAAGTHVGEMTAIDPTTSRSANVRALERTIAARLGDADLVAAATECPDLWRRFAIELASRLRERTRFIRVPNDRPHLFIGSSTEMLSEARAIHAAFEHDDVKVTVWTDGVFRASQNSVTSLLNVAERTDFAALVFGPDDVVISRGDEKTVPRDNVIFELGLFIGAVGRERTYIVVPRGIDLHIPTDLIGVEPLKFSADDSESINSRIAPLCTALREDIKTMGAR